ncbi:MAG: hypothetical protein LRY73_11520 [Bacillus sp. (in: Bacteria)]|nr:hypothetical protein [Bacillus sp. (in: firmicutes)]
MNKYLPFIVIALLVAGAMYFFGDSKEVLPIAGEEEIRRMTELEEFEREIHLPTYVPFEIWRVTFDSYYVGPFEYGDRETTYLHEDEEKYWSIELVYHANEESGEIIRVMTANADVILEMNELPPHEEIDLADGNVGYYVPDEFGARLIIWIMDEWIYVLDYMGKSGEHASKEELTKIVESFREYRP